jgi:hypothetical protein
MSELRVALNPVHLLDEIVCEPAVDFVTWKSSAPAVFGSCARDVVVEGAAALRLTRALLVAGEPPERLAVSERLALIPRFLSASQSEPTGKGAVAVFELVSDAQVSTTQVAESLLAWCRSNSVTSLILDGTQIVVSVDARPFLDAAALALDATSKR